MTDKAELIPMPAPQRSLAVTPMEMIALAVERGADVAQLEKLMDLQLRWEANEARKAFVAALAAFKADPPTIQKNKHVRFATQKGETEYDHATLDNVVAMITPALSKHGLSHRWETEQGGEHGQIKVTCILTHVLGHSERVTLQSGPDQSGGKNNIQAVGSTVSYLQRYTLLAATGLATSDMDDDGRKTLDFITPEQKDQLISLMKETGADTKRFLAYLGVAALDDLVASQFDHAVAALQKKSSKT